jgi:hypothetical protein
LQIRLYHRNAGKNVLFFSAFTRKSLKQLLLRIYGNFQETDWCITGTVCTTGTYGTGFWIKFVSAACTGTGICPKFSTFLGFKVDENSAEEAMMEINGGEVIEVPKTIKKVSGSSSTPGEAVLPADQKPGWKSVGSNPDVAEADSQLAEQENGPEGKHDIPNDDQDPGGEVKGEEDAVVEAAVKKAAEAVVGLNLAEDVVDEGGAAPPDGEAVVNGEIVKDKKGEEENYELDRAAEENSL